MEDFIYASVFFFTQWNHLWGSLLGTECEERWRKMCQLVDSENFILLQQQVSVYFHFLSGIILSTWPHVFLVVEHYTSLESWCCDQDCWVLLGGGDWNAQRSEYSERLGQSTTTTTEMTQNNIEDSNP